jgi:hypothetical protein
MDKQVRRLVDDDDVFVAMEDDEFFRQRSAASQRPESPCR